MSKDKNTENTQAASASQSDRGYTFSGFQKRRDFRAFINGDTALRQRVIDSAIKRVEERNKAK